MADPARIEELPPDAIDGYFIREIIGKGGSGVVFRATRGDSDESVAIKALYPAHSKNKETVSRLMRETRLTSRLRHPNVVASLDWGKVRDSYYIVFEYIDGATLAHDLWRHGKIDERRAAAIALDVARGLEAAHQHGFIHRDIKPGNIMLARDGAARIMDFGLARQEVDRGVTVHGTILGTPSYISPEQIRSDRQLDIRTDLYALGATLYHAVTGAPPFANSSLSLLLTKKMIEEVPDPREAEPTLSEGMAFVIRRLTRKDREDRYASPSQVIADLERYLRGEFDADEALLAPEPWGVEDTLDLASDEPVEHPTLRMILSRPSVPCETLSLRRGQVLFYEDDRAEDIYVLMKGKVEALKSGGRMATISTEGALIGEMSYLLDARRSATIRAVEPTLVMRIGEEDFDRTLAECPALARHIAVSLAGRLFETTEKLKEAQTVIGAIRENCDVIAKDMDVF